LFRVLVFAKYGGANYYKVDGTSIEMQAHEQNYRVQFVKEFEAKYTLNIKVVGDHGNWISEKNEDNNMKRTPWPPMTKKRNLEKIRHDSYKKTVNRRNATAAPATRNLNKGSAKGIIIQNDSGPPPSDGHIHPSN
ncbi:MAG: hypothetical protein JRI53_12285, partial [Deltaproteobacteria bacterium]|nr:hypothetical protein [Deltaproteobacteria bacterium]